MSSDPKAETQQSTIATRLTQDENFRQGYVRHLQGDLDQAARFYIMSIEAEPSAVAYTFLGKVLSELGEYDSAIEQCKLAVRLDPTLGNAWNDLGAYLLELKRFNEAHRYLVKASKAKEYDSREFPHFNLARFYQHKGMLVKAREELNTAIRINPEFVQAKEFLSQLDSQIH